MHDKIAGGEALEFFEGERDSARADAVALQAILVITLKYLVIGQKDHGAIGVFEPLV